MGTVLECQVEKHFQNLEKCNEIQGEITTKTIYPIRYPCYIDEISLRNSNNFEKEEKKIQIDANNSNNILKISQNTNYNSNENSVNKNKFLDNIETNLSDNNETIIDETIEEKDINNKIEDKTKKQKEKNDKVYKEGDKNKKLNEKKLSKNNINKQNNNNNSNSYDSLKNIETEIDYYYNKNLENKNKLNSNKENNFKNANKEHDLKDKYENGNNILYSNFNKIYVKNKQIKPHDSKNYINNILYKKDNINKKDYYNSQKCFQENSHIKGLKKINSNKQNKIKEKKKNNKINQNNIYHLKKNKYLKIDNILHKIESDKFKKKKEEKKLITNNNEIDNNEKNNNYINNYTDNKYLKRYSYSNKNNFDVYNYINNSKRYNTSFNKTNRTNDKGKNMKSNIYNLKNGKELFRSSNISENKSKKNNKYQNLFLSSITDSVINNNNKKSLPIIHKNAFLEQNTFNKKIRNQIPIYRLSSPDGKTKNINKRRMSYIMGKNNLCISTRSISGATNFNYRDDIWSYLKTDSFLNTYKNKRPKNIINITRYIPHSHSDDFFNLGLNNNKENSNNYLYNSMNFNDDNLINNLRKNNYDSDDTEEKLLYKSNKSNKKYLTNYPKKNKEENNIKDFIKVRIPFNGTQISPFLLNYSTNNIFILNYNNLNKFSVKSILYDGIIYKVINSQNYYTKLISRYFQITKSCFRYYKNIYSVLIYNAKPLVQFDIRYIENIKILNINLMNKSEEIKIEFAFSIKLIKDSDYFVFATDDKEFGISIVNVLNLLKNYYDEDRDLFE